MSALFLGYFYLLYGTDKKNGCDIEKLGMRLSDCTLSTSLLELEDVYQVVVLPSEHGQSLCDIGRQGACQEGV